MRIGFTYRILNQGFAVNAIKIPINRLISRIAFSDNNTRQAGATPERINTDLGYRIGDGDARQAGAIFERSNTDLGY